MNVSEQVYHETLHTKWSAGRDQVLQRLEKRAELEIVAYNLDVSEIVPRNCSHNLQAVAEGRKIHLTSPPRFTCLWQFAISWKVKAPLYLENYE
jgi:hypothetical protein